MADEIEGRSRELLEARNFCHVATIDSDGTPHVAVVWVDVNGSDVLLNGAEGREWPENLRRDPRVTLTVVNHENPYEYVSIDGRVVEMTHDGADDHIDRMSQKYFGKKRYPDASPDQTRLLIRVRPDKISVRGG
jgi:PPOX class probable F420-dependent enzyme